MRRSSRLATRLAVLRGQAAPEALQPVDLRILTPVATGSLQQGVARDLSHPQNCTCSFHTSCISLKQPPAPKDVPLDSEHVNIGNENDKEIIRATDKDTAESIFDVVKMHGEEFTETNVATTFHALAQWGAKKETVEKEKIHGDPTFQHLIDMVVQGRRRYDVKHLAQILRSLAALEYDNDMVSDRLSQHIMDKLPKADAKTLVDLTGGLAEMEHSPSVVLFEAIEKRAVELKEDIGKEQKIAIEKAFQKLGYEHKEISSEVK